MTECARRPRRGRGRAGVPPTIYPSLREAIADFPDGASLMIPGFGPAGNPWNLLEALYEQGATGLTAIMNSANQRSADPALKSFTDLVAAGRVRKVVASFTASTHPSRPNVVEALARKGRIAVELTPQGTLAERIRAGGAGIPAFYTPAGVGTAIAEGKELRRFNGRPYLLETALTADYAFVRGLEGGCGREPRVPQNGPQPEPHHGDGRRLHDRGGGAAHRPRGSARPGWDPYARRVCAAAGPDPVGKRVRDRRMAPRARERSAQG